MRDKLEEREAYRLTFSFAVICHDVHQALYKKRPASVGRLSQAAGRMMHFVIHSQTRLKRRYGQKRVARALLIGSAAQAILKRLSSETEHRAIITATAEVLERAISALEKEVIHEEIA